MIYSLLILQGTGFHIGGGRIITNSHVLRNHTSLRLSRHGKPGNFAGRVLCDGRLSGRPRVALSTTAISLRTCQLCRSNKRCQTWTTRLSLLATL